jgi:septum formation protein
LRLIVLASESPRRKELLERAGLRFSVAASDYEEDLGLDMPPHELAAHLSKGKAASVAGKHPDAVVIAADTFIVLEGKILGKPHTEDEAARMLGLLSGRAHSVITGYTVLDTATGREVSESVETRVWFKELTDDEIEAYVKTGEPLDKAGAYAIQGRGASLVQKIEGDYDNVVGLPVDAVLRSLGRLGGDVSETDEV